jgi:hypothetical protein
LLHDLTGIALFVFALLLFFFLDRALVGVSLLTRKAFRPRGAQAVR